MQSTEIGGLSLPGTRHRMVQVGTDDLMPMRGVPYYWVHPGREREDGMCIGRSKLTRRGSFLGSVKVGASVHKHIFLIVIKTLKSLVL